MGRNLYHSAEGSHWTKKNHKYIRKEGNRYIYPEDVNKSKQNSPHPHDPKYFPKIKSRKSLSILGEGTTRLTTGDGHYKDINVNRTPNEHRNAYKTVQYSTAYTNYKQHKHPKHNGSNGYGTPLSGEYTKSMAERKELNRQKAMVNEKRQHKIKQENAINNQRSTDYKKLSEQHANRQAAKSGKIVNPTYTLRDNQGNKVARLQSKDKVQMPTVADYKKASQLTSGAKNRKKMVDKQASLDYKQLSKDQRKKQLVNKQGANKHRVYTTIPGDKRGAEYQLSQQQAKEISSSGLTPWHTQNKETVIDTHGNKHVSYNRNARAAYSELGDKLADKGYFTIKNGESVFIPSDEITMRKISKGRRLINKIKNRFLKNTDTTFSPKKSEKKKKK